MLLTLQPVRFSWQHLVCCTMFVYLLCAANREDQDILKTFRQAFEDGRMPIFEPVEGAQDNKLQLTHLSFQELLTGEYTSAIVRSSHAKKQVRPYINYFSSNSAKQMNRDRLAENWWMQVWFHIGEMLTPVAFNDWCDCLAEDQRAKVKVGSVTYRPLLGLSAMWEDRGRPQGVRPAPWEDGAGFGPVVVEHINWETHMVKIKVVHGSCVRKMDPGLAPHTKLWESCLLQLSDIQFPADGVATIFREASKQGDLDLVKRLLDKGVHYGVIDDMSLYPLVKCTAAKQWDILKLFCDHKALPPIDYPTILTSSGHYAKGGWSHFEYWAAVGLHEGYDELKRAKRPTGVLEQAHAGTLQVTPELDVNFQDPASGMSLLMYAAAGGQPKTVAALIASKASVNAESKDACTALRFACDCARGPEGTECVRLLLDGKAEVNRSCGKIYGGREFFEKWGRGNPMATGLVNAGEVDKLDLLLQAGYDVHRTNDYGMPLIMNAFISTCEQELQIQIVQKLLDQKADPCNIRYQLSNGCTHVANAKSFPCEERYSMLFCLGSFTCNPHWTRYCMQEMGEDGNGFYAHEFGMKMPLIMPYFSWAAPLLQDADLSCMIAFLDGKLDLNQPLKQGSFKITMMGFAAITCNSPHALLLFFERKGDLGNLCGWMGKDFISWAKLSKNEVAEDTYNDWLLMQEDRAAQGDSPEPAFASGQHGSDPIGVTTHDADGLDAREEYIVV